MILPLSTNLKEFKVSLEWFLKLKEYDSLTKMKGTHLKAIQEQEERLTKLNSRALECDMQTTKLRENNLALRHRLHDIDLLIKSHQEQRQRLLDRGEDGKKVETYSAQIDQAEEEGLEILSQIESQEKELADLSEFKKGLAKTLNEIQEEANHINAQEKQALSNIDLRIQLIEEELPSNFRTTLNKVVAKNLAKGPFTRIEAGSCYFCRYKISRIDESEIDSQRMLKLCPQCSRIFLPYGA